MNDPTPPDGPRPAPAAQTTVIPLRAPPGKSEGWALRGFTDFELIVTGLCWATSPQGEPAMIQVEGFPNVKYRDFMRRQRMWPTLFEVSEEAWKKKAASLRRQAQRREQRRKHPQLGQLLSITNAAMFVPGNTEEVVARIKRMVPSRPGVGKRTKRVVLWDDVLAAFPVMKRS